MRELVAHAVRQVAAGNVELRGAGLDIDDRLGPVVGGHRAEAHVVEDLILQVHVAAKHGAELH